MSIKILTEAWAMKVGDSTRKLVLMCLADHANEADASCWPSLSLIAEKCEVSVRTVRRHLRQLEDDGFISTQERSGNSSRYSVTLSNTREDKMTGVQNLHPGHPCPPTPVTDDRTPRSPMTAKPERTGKEPSEQEGAAMAAKREAVSRFEFLWDNWECVEGMVKGSKTAALQKFLKLKPEDQKKAAIMAEPYCDRCRTTKTKTAHISTWINQRRFDDEAELQQEAAE